MPETTDDFDLDAWLDGAKRTERAVTVYARADLLADIDRLEAEKAVEEAVNGAERSIADDGGARIQAKIDALLFDLDKSKLELRVTFLDDEEQNAIRDAVKKDLKETADEAAKKAAQEARDSCRRAEITAVNDVNQIVRRMTTEAANKVIEREVSIRTLAACIVSPRMSVDQVRKLYTKIGDSQLAVITAAYTRASVEAPEVQVPKSLAPSHSDDGAMSS